MNMDVRNMRAGDLVMKMQDPVVEWYLIKSGSVVRKFAITETVLRAGAIIGLMEGDFSDCDYAAVEDTVLVVLPCKNAEDLARILEQNQGFRIPFLRTALDQRQQALLLYEEMRQKAERLHEKAEELYSDYETICGEMVIAQHSLIKMQKFAAVQMRHRAEQWEIRTSNSITGKFKDPYLKFACQDSAICVGAIMEASAQMHRITLGIKEFIAYLLSNREILYSSTGDDIYHLYSELGVAIAKRKESTDLVKQKLSEIVSLMKELGLYDRYTIMEAEDGCDHLGEMKGDSGEKSTNPVRMDCVQIIMEYAGLEQREIYEYKDLLKEYRELPEQHASDDRSRELRSRICEGFYQIYYMAFVRSQMEPDPIPPVVNMFFIFGFMDTQLAGEDATGTLYGMLSSMSLFESGRIQTFYSWLSSIYRGEREPSKSDMGQDFPSYLENLRLERKITDQQAKELLDNGLAKVQFEINHSFRYAQRVTYGRVTSFCPVLSGEEIMGSLSAMAVTAERLQLAVNKVRKVDYSIFYREILFEDEKRGIPKDWIKNEVLPDMILLPNMGEKVFLWQECSGKKSSTPGRFMVPIFMMGDLEREMVLNLGRFRWEICRKEEGAYWNDVRQHSLTAEYCDFLQFYKKNHSLSETAKEKIKLDLQRSRNNYREVFVNDYEMWIRYESKGSFRLNRVTREMMIRHCPFHVEIRQKLKMNPQFEQAFNRIDQENEKRATRLNLMYNRITASGGTIPPELQENLLYYSM